MSAPQINITLGTAGHIDHGKTALIKNLTGCDTDRLKEEKERGMSIELGFAPCTLGAVEVGIVDVPGHEHFVKTMVAGASGMDGVLFVVAADDGVMPQTREHLDILTLLGIRHGVVALTKMDRIAPDLLELAREDVRGLLRGTFLEAAPIIPVSNVTGDGLGDLCRALESMIATMRPRQADGVFRLPVERAFSVRGFGTIVSGVPAAGSARVGDELELLPQGLTGRIRAIQVYGRESDVVSVGQCAALNMRPWEPHGIERGCVVVAPGCFSPSPWYACRLRLLPEERASIKSGVQVKFHTGTAEVLATVYLLRGQQMQPGEDEVVQVRTSHAIVAGPGDRFIIRALSPVRTIGGGVVVEATPARLKRTQPGLYDELHARADAVGDPASFVEYCLRTAPNRAATIAEIAQRAKVPEPRVAALLEALAAEDKAVTLSDGLYAHRAVADATDARILQAIQRFHEASPKSPGITTDDLCADLAQPKPVVEAFIARLARAGRLTERNHRFALAEHRVAFSDAEQQLVARVEGLFHEALFAPPSVEDVVHITGAAPDKARWAVGVLLQHERLVRVAEGLLFHADAVQQAREAITAHIGQHGRLESVDFKYLLDTTRKYAIPLLDYFDRIGVTLRVGNTRHLRSGRPGTT